MTKVASNHDIKSVLSLCIAGNNCGTDFIKTRNYAFAITGLQKALESLMSLQNEENATNRGDRLHQFRHIQPLMDIDVLFPMHPETGIKAFPNGNSSQLVFASPVRIPPPLSGCVQAIHAVKVVISFNLALSCHLGALYCRKRQDVLFKRAYDIYRFALGLQPACAKSSKAFFQIVTLYNLGSICASLGETEKRNLHQEGVISRVVFMTSYEHMDSAIYEAFLDDPLSQTCGSHACSGAA